MIQNSQKKVTESTSIRTTGEIIATIKDEHAIFREKHNQNHLALPSISDRTYLKIARTIASEIIKNPITQSLHQEKVMNDSYTGISQAVISHAIQGIVPTYDGKPDPSSTWNFDSISCDINGEIMWKHPSRSREDEEIER